MYEYRALIALVALIVVVVGMHLAGVDAKAFGYERNELRVEPWRALTHSLVHINQYQLAVSVTTLVALYFLFSGSFISLWWVAALFASSAAAAYGALYYSPTLNWSAGMYPALHGLFLYTALRVRANPIWIVLLGIKLLLEQTGVLVENSQIDAVLPNSMRYYSMVFLVDNPKAVDANLWGAAGGLFFYFLIRSIANTRQFLTVALER